jgi:protein PhnA
MYLNKETLTWAQATSAEDVNKIIQRDSNGIIVEHDDSIVLTKT